MNSRDVEFDNKLIIDWLAFTIPVSRIEDLRADNVAKLVNFLLGFDLRYEVKNKGRFGYSSMITFCNKVNVYFTDSSYFVDLSDIQVEHFFSMGINVEITGVGCRLIESNISDWHPLLERVLSHSANITRIDIAYDDYNKRLDLDMIVEKIDRGEIVSPFRNFKVEDSFVSKSYKQGVKGLTVYLGDRKSDFFVRLYDKAAEQKSKNGIDFGVPWQRYEIELKRKYALDFVLKFVNKEASISELYFGILKRKIRFVDCVGSDGNKGRWPVSKFWDDFISTENIEISLSKGDFAPSLMSVADWFMSSVPSVLLLLDKIFSEKNVDLIGLIKSNCLINDRHKAFYDEFSLLSDKEKEKILLDILNILKK